jgi:hypothetical protein
MSQNRAAGRHHERGGGKLVVADVASACHTSKMAIGSANGLGNHRSKRSFVVEVNKFRIIPG